MFVFKINVLFIEWNTQDCKPKWNNDYTKLIKNEYFHVSDNFLCFVCHFLAKYF